MNLYRLEHHDLTLTYTDMPLVLPKTAVEWMLGQLKRWEKAFPKEDTFVQRMWGVPSALVRFDGALDERGDFQAYEIQDGPGWAGYAGVINPEFKRLRDGLRERAWPRFKLVMRKQGFDHDDDLWLERTNVKGTLEEACPLMVRRLPPQISDEDRTRIVRRSLKPVDTHSDKTYGLEMGWWKKISDAKDLPWTEGFALKPIDGMGSEDVMLWKPDVRPGRATRTQIEAALKERGEMILQIFVEPMHIDLDGKPHHAILRPFFGYDPKEKRWVALGGVWTARPVPNLRVHGSSDAISGPLVLE